MLNPAETAAYDALPEEERVSFFFRTWTAKEALFKAAGEDVFHPARQDTLQGGVKSYEKPIGGETYALSVATKTTERIRLYENITL